MATDPFEKAKSQVHTEIEPEEFKGNTLGGKFGNTIIRVFKKITNSITDWFEERLINFAVGVLVKVEQSGKTVLGSLIKELKDKKAIPDFLKPVFDEIENPKHEIGAMLAGQAGSNAIGGLFGAIFDPLMANVKYTLNKVITPYYLDISQAVMGRLFEIIGEDTLTDTIKAQGYKAEFTGLFKKLFKNKIPFNELVQLKLRGKITEPLFEQGLRDLALDNFDIQMLKGLIYRVPEITDSVTAFFRGSITEIKLKEIAEQNGVPQEFLDIIIAANRKLLEIMDIRAVYYRAGKGDDWLDKALSMQGYSPETISEIKEILPYFPAVPDLIRFAVREVYTPDIVSKYGQLEDLPPKFLEEAKKAGLPAEQAKNFWAAHWELPSVLMGYEMFHRDVISEDDLKTLMRTLDIMPYWRDKLIQISYNPLTRVDVRRMYGLGVLNEEEVFKSYKAIGYNDDNARKMTEFTKLYGQAAEKNLTKTDVLEGYQRKYFSYQETLDFIMSLGYDQVEAEYYISKIDYKEEKERKTDTIDLFKDMYTKGIVDDNIVIQELAKYGVTTPEINYYLSKWSLSKIGKVTLPSVTDLKNWLKGKIVSRETFIQEMANLGYPDKYIDYYLMEITKKGL